MKKSFKEITTEFALSKETSTFDSSLKVRPTFDVLHLKMVDDFLNSVDQKCRDKIEDIVENARKHIDPKFFKKLTNNIWEFRIAHRGIQYRLLAFWEGLDARPLVRTTHVFVKKTGKVPKKELRRAEEIRSWYLYKNQQNEKQRKNFDVDQSR